ncbi:MAG: glycosyltransferase family 2 protein [Lachnospiraceae bacterium]|nr:glycosyltransferase family 2 protein [Lachnospiraceae bacterium]
MKYQKKTVDIVVPCYNEEEVLHMFYQETQKILDTIEDYQFRYLFIDDGSRDKTLFILRELAASHPHISYLSFSRNFGKEAGIYAGLKHTVADYIIVMDADLQHPPALIPTMIEAVKEGYDCCAAMRLSRKGESKIRSAFSRIFYKISNRFTDVKMEQNAVDFRIMSRQMVDSILELSEVQRFSKGIFAWVGYRTKWLPYENVERPAGKSKWSFWGLFKYAIDGITAFSIAPLRLVSTMGCIISFFAFIYIVITLIQTLIFGIDVPGYVTTLCAVLFLGGIMELSIGILGEYIGHIYMEAKDRPIYLIKETNLPKKHTAVSKAADEYSHRNEENYDTSTME